METKLLHSLLRADFFNENQSNVGATLFEDELRDVYKAIEEGHSKYDTDLSVDDVEAIWLKNNPVATRSEKEEIQDLLTIIRDEDPLSDGVAHDYIKELWKRHVGHKIANIGIELTEGVPDAMHRLESLIESVRDGVMPDDFGEPVTDDIETLLAQFSDDARWKFNIETLSRHVYGIGPSEFGVVFALPETGKSAFALSVCCAPGGFCEQGAKVLYLGNEEKADRTKIRAIGCWAGMSQEEMHEDPRRAATQWMAIRDRMVMMNTQEWTLDKIEAYANKVKPDVIVIDQADKVEIRGSFSASHERLRELYRSLREMAKRLDCALLVVSQASNDAKGRTRLSPFDMEGSKIGKAAETDLIIGIGKHEAKDVDDTEPDTTRFVTVSKNKLSGWHGTVICNLIPQISRYVE